jgi:hypothetical protein
VQLDIKAKFIGRLESLYGLSVLCLMW